jgi:tellurite methyltransferase
MSLKDSVNFFDQQFASQINQHAYELNPFEQIALPFLGGQILDYGCGLGNLSVAAATRGCAVHALDASPNAIADLQKRSALMNLPIQSELADLSHYRLTKVYDSIASVGLLSFLPCDAAFKVLESLKQHTKAGGVLALNSLIAGTTCMHIFGSGSNCLFARSELEQCFEGWTFLYSAYSEYDAPGGLNKSFYTVVARKPTVLDIGAPQLAKCTA